uniref:Expansin-like EG45 domain-containing protein n=1 Tax=Tetradesmus obliquus TaxID=3088 RepID=A0A383VI52_TETOB|eukprot:jgi/Sobl393_1/17266/SZX65195.1
MRSAAVALAAVLLTAAAAYCADAVECGSLGDLPLSGCLECEPATVNVTGRDGWHGWKGRRLSQEATAAKFGGNHGGNKPGNGGGWPPKSTESSMTLPNCIECDKANGFEPMPPITSSKWAHPNLGRCGCIDGFGAKPTTENVTVTWGGKTRSMPKFECAKCGETQVTLTAASGVIPVYNKASNKWSLVLIKSLNSRSKAGRFGLPYPLSFHSVWGSKSSAGNRMATPDGRGGRGGGWKKGPGMGPYFPGQCIDCPGTSTKEGTACV